MEDAFHFTHRDKETKPKTAPKISAPTLCECDMCMNLKKKERANIMYNLWLSIWIMGRGRGKEGAVTMGAGAEWESQA